MTNAEVAITITAASDEWTYDGQPHSNTLVTVTEGALLGDDELVAEATGAVTNVADTAAGNNPVGAGYKIMHGTEDVTGNYAITTVDGTLTIKPKAVTITSASDSWEYDGAAHSNTLVTVTEGELLTGDTLNAEGTGVVTNVWDTAAGNNKIAAGYTILRGTEDVTANYAITPENGTLTITPAKLIITAKDQTYGYDGTAHGEDKAAYTDAAEIDGKVTVTGLKGGDALTGVTLDGRETNAGEYPGKIVPSAAVIGKSSAKRMRAAGDPADNYDITYAAGKLTITKAPLTITAKSQSYTYNGKYQGEDGATYTTNLDAKVTVSGLMGSDRLTGITLDGSEKDVGKYAGRIEASEATVSGGAENYEITYVAGDLTIRAAKDDSPGTGDNTKIVLWSTLALVSALGCGGALLLAKGKKRRTAK